VGCVAIPPAEFRPHTWPGNLEEAWQMNETRHWQECVTCPDSNKARISETEHFFGNWFFHVQTDNICQLRFENCTCGLHNPENTRGHELDADDKCTRDGCSYELSTLTIMISMAIDAIEEYDILDSIFGADENEPDDFNTDCRMPEESMQDILDELDKAGGCEY